MPQRSSVVGAPYTWVSRGGSWPVGPFAADAPPGVLYAAEIAMRLGAAIAESGQTMTAVAKSLGVARSTIYDALNGAVFIDSFTLAAAEAHFGVRLWPEHIPTTR